MMINNVKKRFKRFIADYHKAAESKEQYDKCQVFFKGQYIEPTSVYEFMSFSLPQWVVKGATWTRKVLSFRESYIVGIGLMVLAAIAYDWSK